MKDTVSNSFQEDHENVEERHFDSQNIKSNDK